MGFLGSVGNAFSSLGNLFSGGGGGLLGSLAGFGLLGPMVGPAIGGAAGSALTGGNLGQDITSAALGTGIEGLLAGGGALAGPALAGAGIGAGMSGLDAFAPEVGGLTTAGWGDAASLAGPMTAAADTFASDVLPLTGSLGIPDTAMGGGVGAWPGFDSMMAGTGFDVGSAGLSPDLGAGLGTVTDAFSPDAGTYGTAAKKGVGSILGTLGKYAIPGYLGAGLLSNVAGNVMGANQAKTNLKDYTNAVTWTPEKSAAYINATKANTAGTAGAAGARAKGTLAEQMAAAGRGGGGYGAQAQAIDEATLSAIAQSGNQALTTVSTPPNLSPAPFMSQVNPWGTSLQGLSGTLGNLATTTWGMQLLGDLFKNLKA